ncbi:MAG: glutamate synthase subunit alpha, partial [Thiotrichaceae bacterium]|nr:glutamate synthase subunit alpha [Thiotrichaceae bacterium]
LSETAEHCHKIELESPVLSNAELQKINALDDHNFQTKTLDILFRATDKPGALEKSIKRICRYAEDAIYDGYSIIILSDRSITSEHAAIPAMLITSAVHHYLIKRGLRAQCDLVIETGDVRETHHFATVIGYGASAINPYLIEELAVDLKSKGRLTNEQNSAETFATYKKAIDAGLLKIFAKMGVSTLQSYQGAQIFEALGISNSVIDLYFTGTISRIGGLTIDDIAKEILIRHRAAYPEREIPIKQLESGGIFQWKPKGEKHLFNPKTISLLQSSTRENDYNKFKEYCAEVNDQSDKAATLRSQLEFVINKNQSIPLSEVEPTASILKRFATGAMSFGSISHEAHSTLAIAMNRIGGKSNS